MGLCRIHGPSSVVRKVLCSIPRHHRTRWPIEGAALLVVLKGDGGCSLSVGLLEMGGDIFSCCDNLKAWPDFSGNTMDNLSKRIIVLHKMLIAPRFGREIIVSSQHCTTVRKKKKGLYAELQPGRVLYDPCHWLIGQTTRHKQNLRGEVLFAELYLPSDKGLLLHIESDKGFYMVNTIPAEPNIGNIYKYTCINFCLRALGAFIESSFHVWKKILSFSPPLAGVTAGGPWIATSG